MALPSPQRSDRAFTLVLIAVGIIVALTLIGVLALIPVSLHSSNNGDQIKQGNQLQSCRSSFHSVLVDTPTTNLAVANATQGNIIADGLRATIANNTPQLVRDDTQLETAEKAVTAAESAIVAGTKKYQEAVRLSRTNPMRFLAECNALPE